MKNKIHKKHTHGIIFMDMYAQKSNMRDVNSQLKLVSSMLLLIYCVSVDITLIHVIIGISMVFLTVGLAKIPRGYYFNLIKLPIAFILISCITIIIDFSKTPLGIYNFKIGTVFLCVTKTGLLESLKLFFKAYGAVTCLYFLSLTTPMQDIIESLKKIHLPTVVIELMYLIYRYIFLLQDVQNAMTTSAMCRLGYDGGKNAWYTFTHISGNVLVNSFKRSRDSFNAMEARCYEGDLCFLSEEHKVKNKHLLFVLVYAICIILCTIFLSKKGIDLF
ncbi:cobalt ECF transporter T component CbiQ [Hathewaya proteolytica]|nr:cobalt ECF transporter T component CbiQ [Hathewaya proteolytica]